MNTTLSGIAVISLIAAILLMGVSPHQFTSAQAELRPLLPPMLQEDIAVRFAMDKYVWDYSVPLIARRQYMRSLVFETFSIGLITIFVAIEGTALWSIAFASVFLIGVTHTLVRWIKYRERL
jgi:hypothetical protein